MVGGKEYMSVSTFYKSFSGTDTIVFIMLPGSAPVTLGTISTISYSMYRTKQPVINLGRTNINGITRGARIYAGSIIFTMINQHWLNELQDTKETSWLGKYKMLKSDELPLFDLLIVSANEYGSYVTMYIYGVDITDEGQVVSVNDMFTENTCTFVARDIESFKAGTVFAPDEASHTSMSSASIKSVKISSAGMDGIEYGSPDESDYYSQGKTGDAPHKTIVMGAHYEVPSKSGGMYPGILPDGTADEDPLETALETAHAPYYEKRMQEKAAAERARKLKGWTRELEYRPYNTMAGKDVHDVQLMLEKLDVLEYGSNLYDKETEDAVKGFQSSIGMRPTGIVDAKTWLALMGINEKDVTAGCIVNMAGAFVYMFPDAYNANVVDILPYGEMIEILGIDEHNGIKYYRIKQGWIKADDAYSIMHNSSSFDFPLVKPGDTGWAVAELQALLMLKYEFDHEYMTYNKSMQDLIIKIQKENNIACEYGIVNDNTWRVLEALTGASITDIARNKLSITAANPQGEYAVKTADFDSVFMSGFNITLASAKPMPVRATCITYYPDGHSDGMIREYRVDGEHITVIPFSAFKQAFKPSSEHGIPEGAEYIICPPDGESAKWTIRISK